MSSSPISSLQFRRNPPKDLLPFVSRKEISIWDDTLSMNGGYLLKKISANRNPFRFKWQKRWFWLNLDLEEHDNYHLHYSHTPGDYTHMHRIPCANARIVVHSETIFTFFGNEYKPLTLKADSEDIAYRWTKTLAHVITVAELRKELIARHSSPKISPRSKTKGHRRPSMFSLASIDEEDFDVDDNDDNDEIEEDFSDTFDSACGKSSNISIEIPSQGSEDAETDGEYSLKSIRSFTMKDNVIQDEDQLAQMYLKKRDEIITVGPRNPEEAVETSELSSQLNYIWFSLSNFAKLIFMFVVMSIFLVLYIIGTFITSVAFLCCSFALYIFSSPFLVVKYIYKYVTSKH